MLTTNIRDSKEGTLSATIAAERMATLAKGVKEILSAFASAKFIGSFTVDEEDIADKIFAESSFAEVRHCHGYLFFKLTLYRIANEIFCFHV